jgi:hypothetical protein
MSTNYIWLLERSLSLSPLKVDRASGTIFNVKIIGFDSENNRKYLPNALKEAKGLYENVKVNIDHPKNDPTDARSAYDRFGKLVNVRYVEGKGLFGDLVYLKSHPMANRIIEAAERMPEAFGLSHNAQGEGEKEGDIFVVNKVTEVRHVDLVADPATTKSLSEAAPRKPLTPAQKQKKREWYKKNRSSKAMAKAGKKSSRIRQAKNYSKARKLKKASISRADLKKSRLKMAKKINKARKSKNPNVKFKSQLSMVRDNLDYKLKLMAHSLVESFNRGKVS